MCVSNKSLPCSQGEDLSRRAKRDGTRLADELVALKLAMKLGGNSSIAVAAAVAMPAASLSGSQGRGGSGRGSSSR